MMIILHYLLMLLGAIFGLVGATAVLFGSPALAVAGVGFVVLSVAGMYGLYLRIPRYRQAKSKAP